MDGNLGTHIHGSQRLNSTDSDQLTFPLAPFSVGWIAMTFLTDVYVPLGMNLNNFSDSLSFHSSDPSSGQNF